MTKYLERKLIEALRKNFDDKDVAKRMAYMREHNIEDEFKHLPVEEAIFGICMDLEELDYCSCGRLELREHLTGVQDNKLCRSCKGDV